MNRKFIAESLEELIEGVGDKYAERKWGIPDEDVEWERKFYKTKIEKDKIIYSGPPEIGDIVKNPSSFKGFTPDVRGVILENGDIYMCTNSEGFIHSGIIEKLFEKGIIRGSEKIIAYHLEIISKLGFLTVQRYKNTNIIAIGESITYLRGLKDYYYNPLKGYTRKELLEMAKEFLRSGKKKNPQFKYSYDLIDVKNGPKKFV